MAPGKNVSKLVKPGTVYRVGMVGLWALCTALLVDGLMQLMQLSQIPGPTSGQHDRVVVVHAPHQNLGVGSADLGKMAQSLWGPLPEEVPDAGPEPTPTFETLYVGLVSIVWFEEEPWASTVQLERADESKIYTMGDCDGLAPCNLIFGDWRLIRIGQDRVMVQHIPSGGTQVLMFERSADEEDAGGPPQFKGFYIWNRNRAVDSDF